MSDGDSAIEKINRIFSRKKSYYDDKKEFDVFHVYDDFFEPGKDIIVRSLAKKDYKNTFNKDINALANFYNEEWDKGDHPEFRRLT